MSVRLVFDEVRSDDGRSQINVSIELNEHSEDDVATNWARLGLRYATQMMADKDLEFDAQLPVIPAIITFDDSNNDNREGLPITFTLNTGDAIDYIGGLTIPTVVLAHEVFTCLNEKYEMTAEKPEEVASTDNNQ